MNHALTLLLAAAMGLLGARMVFQTRRQLAEANAAHRRRLDDRLSRGADAYADELRSIEAYRPIASVRQRRFLGAVMMILSLSAFILFLISPE